LVFFDGPYFVEFVSVVVVGDDDVVLVVGQVDWVVEVQAGSVLIKMHLPRHAIQHIQTHRRGILTGQHRQVREIDILENDLAIINQGDMRPLFAPERRRRRHHPLPLIQIKIPDLHNLLINLFPPNNPTLLLRVEVEVFLMCVALAQSILQRLVPVGDDDRLVVELVDRGQRGARDSVEGRDAAVLLYFLEDQVLGVVVVGYQHGGLELVVLAQVH